MRILALFAFAALSAAAIVACEGDDTSSHAGRLADGGVDLSSTACTTVVPTPPCDASGDPGTVISIASGMSHTCALYSGGTVKCWGDNGYGQIGVGAGCLQNTSVPLTVSNLCNAKAISAGDLHTCALLQDGTVACWGYGGPGRVADQTSPMTIDAGSGQKCDVLVSSGQPYLVGSKPALVPCLSNVTSIAAGNSLDCAVVGDGSMACWGLSMNALPITPVTGLQNVIGSAVEGQSACALRSDGTVACLGANESGELGNPNLKYSSVPIDVQSLPHATAITAGSPPSGTSLCPACYGYSCALLADGTVDCWGEDQNGELGNATTARVATPSPVAVVGLTNVVSVVGGEGHVFAIRSDGTLAAWGANRCGELGDGRMSTATKPITVPGLAHVMSAASGSCHACALTSDGVVQCWGNGDEGQLGNGAETSSLTPVRVML